LSRLAGAIGTRRRRLATHPRRVDRERRRLLAEAELTERARAVLERVDPHVDPADAMHAGDSAHYLRVGLSAIACIEAAGVKDPRRILDLPCGHGRVTRILRAAFPATTLIACDLERDGVDFCAETFGAEPLYSDTDPARVQLDQQVDVTWVGSLLTHIAFERWDGFMELFARSLRPGGVLVFTTFDHPRLPSLGAMNLPDAERLLRDRVEHGVGFQPYVEQDDYGVALVSPEHVRQAIEAEERFEVLSHRPLSWFPPTPIQDTWICRRLGTD
jgi:SAM-dependent methyltransferase